MDKDTLVSFWRDKIRKEVLEAFNTVPREEFVPLELKSKAYEDVPLPIPRNKTISQPSTVLIMTEALELKKGQKVLEVGTGSGYQAALVGKLIDSGKLITTEVIPELVAFAKNNIAKLGIKNVKIIETDGSQGYEEEAPYDRIIVTAAAPGTPLKLLDQLKQGGIMVAPVGNLDTQQMIKYVKHEGYIEQNVLGEFVFSPMLGKYGFDEEKLT